MVFLAVLCFDYNPLLHDYPSQWYTCVGLLSGEEVPQLWWVGCPPEAFCNMMLYDNFHSEELFKIRCMTRCIRFASLKMGFLNTPLNSFTIFPKIGNGKNSHHYPQNTPSQPIGASLFKVDG